MRKFIALWTPDITIAAIVIVGCMIMKFCGIDGEVWALLILAAGWVFGGTWQKRHKAKEETDK